MQSYKIREAFDGRVKIVVTCDHGHRTPITLSERQIIRMLEKIEFEKIINKAKTWE